MYGNFLRDSLFTNPTYSPEPSRRTFEFFFNFKLPKPNKERIIVSRDELRRILKSKVPNISINSKSNQLTFVTLTKLLLVYIVITMITTPIATGNSRGARIPKPLINESGLGDKVELRVKKGGYGLLQYL